MEGLTGQISFDSLGFRSNFNLDIVELKKEGLTKVGSWNREIGVNFTRNFTEAYEGIKNSLKNQTLKITTIMNEPYIMRKESTEELYGNDRYEGYRLFLVRTTHSCNNYAKI
jgi:hypothetical protein